MSRAGDNTGAGLQAAASLVNPFLGAGVAAVNFLFGGGGFSPAARRTGWASNTLSTLARDVGVPTYSNPLPPIPTELERGRPYQGNEYLALQTQRDNAALAQQMFPTRAGMSETPDELFVRNWRASEINRDEAAVLAGWQRFAQVNLGLKAAGYAPLSSEEFWGAAPSQSTARKSRDWLGLGLSVLPAAIELAKPAASVKPIPTGGPNPGVPQLAFVGTIPEVIVTAPRWVPTAARAIRAGLAAAKLLMAAPKPLPKGPPRRYRPRRTSPPTRPPSRPPRRPDFEPLPPQPRPVRPPVPAPAPPPMPEVVVTTPRLPPAPAFFPNIQEIIVTASGSVGAPRAPRAPATSSRPRLSLPTGLEALAPSLAALSSPAPASSPRTSLSSATALAQLVSPLLAPFVSPAAWPAPSLQLELSPATAVPGGRPGTTPRPELRPELRAQVATQQQQCVCVGSPRTAPKRKKGKPKEPRKCFTESQLKKRDAQKRRKRKARDAGNVRSIVEREINSEVNRRLRKAIPNAALRRLVVTGANAAERKVKSWLATQSSARRPSPPAPSSKTP